MLTSFSSEDAAIEKFICIIISLAAFSSQSLLSAETSGSPLAAQKGAAANICWSPEALRGRSVDKTVRKDTPLAIVEPPVGEMVRYSPIPRAARGAIRRIDLPPGIKKLAFTFDLCEQPYEVAGYDSDIINYLREQGLRATFFAGGKWIGTHKDQAQQLIADPLFEFGNHTWEHRNLRLLSGQKLVDEIRWVQLAYEQQIGALLARKCVGRDGKAVVATNANRRLSLFRFPFGACNKESLDAVGELGLTPIQWDVSSGDPSPSASAELMAEDVTRRVRPGSIVLFHANGRGWHTAKALRLLVPKLKSMGYSFATVTELMQTPGATFEREPICYDSTPGDTDHYDSLAKRLEASYEKFLAKYSRQGVEAIPLSRVPQPVPATAPSRVKEPGSPSAASDLNPPD